MLARPSIELLHRAFPSSVRADVDQALEVIPGEMFPPVDRAIGQVTVEGEALLIPQRVYFEPNPSASGWLPPRSEAILFCLYTRHHSGFVREEHLRRLLEYDWPWVAPYVIQLIGEYVVEIIDVIDANREVLTQETYRAFAAANPAFMNLTRQRVISYWNEYYRRRTPRLQDYAGWRLLQVLRVAG